MGTYSKLKKFSSDVHVYQFNPRVERLDATIGKRNKLEKLSKINGEPKSDEAVAAKINGGFFNMNGSSEYIGSFVDEGLYYSGSSWYYPTLIYWKNNLKLTIEHRPDQSRHAVYQRDAWWAIGVPWTLVVDGKKNFTYDKKTLIAQFGHPYSRAPRTLLGQKIDGTIVMVVVDGRKASSLGVTIEQSASIMLELGCNIAVNLDGGGSSEMIVNGTIKNKPSDGGERSIGTAFMVYGKKQVAQNNSSEDKVVTPSNQKTVTASALNVRSGPGTLYKKVGLLRKGSTVNVLSTSNGWCKITYNGNNSGYVSAKYLG